MQGKKDIARAKKTVKDVVDKRLNEFKALGCKGNLHWFSEMCFCILTANSRAETAINIQNDVGAKGFLELPQSTLARKIKEHGHRFHNTKARFIVEARKFSKIKKILSGMKSKEAREWLVKNVKGLGYKEASHFLRNVGFFDVAILDRHILRFLKDAGLISEVPQLNKKNYLRIEKIFGNLAKKLKMNLGELDLYIWYLKTGKVLK